MSFTIAPPSFKPPADEPARIRAALVRAPIFAGLPDRAIDDLIGRVQLRRVASLSSVVSQGEPGESMFLIVSGRIKVVIMGDKGREVTLALLRPGDIFGELALVDGKTRSAGCVALEPSQLLSLGRDSLVTHMEAYPRTALNLLAELAARLRRADESIAQLALFDVNERLVHRLVSLAAEEGSEVPEGVLVRHRPTQQELANMVGSCRETISRAFNQLARDGLIIPRGRAMVVSQALIERVGRSSAA